jgi:hypothetical protein
LATKTDVESEPVVVVPVVEGTETTAVVVAVVVVEGEKMPVVVAVVETAAVVVVGGAVVGGPVVEEPVFKVVEAAEAHNSESPLFTHTIPAVQVPARYQEGMPQLRIVPTGAGSGRPAGSYVMDFQYRFDMPCLNKGDSSSWHCIPKVTPVHQPPTHKCVTLKSVEPTRGSGTSIPLMSGTVLAPATVTIWFVSPRSAPGAKGGFPAGKVLGSRREAYTPNRAVIPAARFRSTTPSIWKFFSPNSTGTATRVAWKKLADIAV